MVVHFKFDLIFFYNNLFLHGLRIREAILYVKKILCVKILCVPSEAWGEEEDMT